MSAAEDPDIWVEYDIRNEDRVRALRHLEAPFLGHPDEKPKFLAIRYLQSGAAQLYGISDTQISLLEQRITDPDQQPETPGHYFRWLDCRPLSPDGGDRPDGLVLLVQQTIWTRSREDTPECEAAVRGAGLRISMRRTRAQDAAAPTAWEITSSNALVARRPAFVDMLDKLPAASRSLFATGPTPDAARRQVVTDLLDIRDPMVLDTNPSVAELVLRPASEAPLVEPASLVAEMEFVLRNQKTKEAIGYSMLFDVAQNTQLSLVRPLVANCPAFGMVFPSDPASSNGDPEIAPDLPAATLDAYRSSVTLDDLTPPLLGRPQELSGRHVALLGTTGMSPNALGITPPVAGSGGTFNFSSRTDDFAAVSAYHHCNRVFRMAREFYCTSPGYFHPQQFPVPVAHRAPIVITPPSPNPPTDDDPGDRQIFGVNAQVLQDAGSNLTGPLNTRVREIRFALGGIADGKTTPIADPVLNPEDLGVGAFGAACDRRITLHEFAHVIQTAGTGMLELPFAHSIGDALAAILCDPESQFARPNWNTGSLAMRGVTYPWIAEPLRRHDREAADGWGWYGACYDPLHYPDPLDPDGYLAEEIMSSTLFRLYRVIGGDAVGLNGNLNLARRREAADYVAYLIMWAIGLLHLGSVAPSTPGILATALMEADALTGLFTYGGQTRQGGALAKIIRWAFEQQGYYWPLGAAWPRNGPGAPPAVDVFLEDEAGRGGGYEFTDRWQARSDAVRVQPRGGNPAQDGAPQRGQPNLVHVTVRNRGTSAGAVTARAWAASGAAVDIWEDNAALWTPLRLQNAAVSTPQVPVPPGQAVEVGAFEWTPLAAGRHTVMVSIDAPGDRSPLHPPIILACATGPTPVAQLVPFDNNLGYRTWVIA